MATTDCRWVGVRGLFFVSALMVFLVLYFNSFYGQNQYRATDITGNYIALKKVSLNSEYEQTVLNDIFICIKSTKRNHRTRLKLLLDTWIPQALKQTYIFTDGEDKLSIPDGHLINTNCSKSYSTTAISCKMSAEYEFFMRTQRRWFCHFDDDTYVNVPGLVKLLRNYNHTDDWYLGKPSLSHPKLIKRLRTDHEKNVTFWFATGGPGICISRSLALKMAPYASDGRFMLISAMVSQADDVTIGFIINYILKVKLTVIDRFHSHYEKLSLVKNLTDQITIQYISSNRISIGGISPKKDPSRFYSFHCMMFPKSKICGVLRGNKTSTN